MKQGKLLHIAISVPDVEKAAAFYEAAFGLERVTESKLSIRLSDGTFHNMDDAEIPIERAEHKYRDPFGVVIDVSTLGWPGASNDV